MKLYLADKNKISIYNLPQKIEDSFLINYITDTGLEENITIMAKEGKWQIESNPETTFYKNSQVIKTDILENNASFQVKFSDLESYLTLYCFDTPTKYISYNLNNTETIKIGKSTEANIVYDNVYMTSINIKIIKQNGYWFFENSYKENKVYVNNYACDQKILYLGDTIFINGLKIVWMDNYIKINIPKDKLSLSFPKYEKQKTDGNVFTEVTDTEKASKLYNDNQVFFHTPRLKETIKEHNISIQLPPKKAENNKAPLILQMGGSMVMGISSSISGVIAVFNIIKGTATLLSTITEITVCLSMLLGSIFFPILLDKYQKRQDKKQELKRQTKYKEYLNKKTEEINKYMEKEKEILLENNLNLEEIKNNLIQRTNKIWNREITDSDFLNIRLGIGNIKPKITVTANLDDFSLDDDNLKKEVEEIVNRKLLLDNIPITASLIEDKVLPIIIGDEYQKKQQYIDGLILQLITYYSGIDLKIAVITTEENKKKWEYLKYLPHCINNDGSDHFFATTEDEIKQLTSTLEKIRQERIKVISKVDETEEETKNNNNEDNPTQQYKKFNNYYLIITDNFITAKKYEFINKIIDSENNLGFSILMFENNMKNLPSKCNHFIDIKENICGFFSKDLSEENQKTFIPEFQQDNNNADYSQILANIPIIGRSMSNSLPTSLNFLEMYKVGKIDQLNILNRWVKNDPTQSLQAPIGVQTDGKLFELDLHEKAHGPHGLIAGATGSGKSEFIITYILSMALNYHPEEVQFVLIDYKGGGLAGAFENKETKIKLPHLVGVITNLDVAEMNRTLVSIKSELQRRQKIFNEARDSLNESTIDIYKYQQFYREKKVNIPISHLFIISDEFAELKDQQPEFMDELVSIARIGRSLGVHLILATQKPSGVVDDQIWSNSRFKICLKVQTEEDSVELLKRPEAASIKETGRFYLQVGFNEIFEIGQSAWAGAKYIPTDRILKTSDDSIEFIDNNGNLIKKINNEIKNDKQYDLGDQLTNIVKTLSDIAEREQIKTNTLWLPSINPNIYISDLIKKYQFSPEKSKYEMLIGEYDDPEHQFQDKLVIDLMKSGSILINGLSGSGKENLLTTLIYSACIYYNSDDINFYILDFGAEVLNSFSSFPQVGDVITSINKDKVRNQFIKIEREIRKRRELFKDYNGSFENYKNQTGKKLPLIVTILNNYESFMENYMDLDDMMVSELRECSKYGIIFITTAINPNGVRATTAQLYNTRIMLQINDPFEYVFQLDAKKNLRPSKYFGRGLIKLENGTFEFQTALVYEKNKINDVLKEIGKRLQMSNMNKVQQIPNIPKEITSEMMLGEITDIDSVPIGFNIETSEIIKYNFIKNKINIISGIHINTEPQFMLDLVAIMSNIPSIELKIIDLADNMSDCGIEECYNGEFTSVINNIKLAESETKQKVIYIITGIGYIYDKVLDEGIEDLFNIFRGKYNLNNTFFILADNYSSMKKLEKEDWYQSLNKNNGIWLGQGFEKQNTILIKNIKPYDITEEFTGLAYVVKDDTYEIIKSIGARVPKGW